MSESLVDEVRRLEPTIDLLHELIGAGRFTSVTRLTDGFFLGMAPGEVGYNHFLGAPSEVALKRTSALLRRLSDENRGLAVAVLSRFGIRAGRVTFEEV